MKCFLFVFLLLGSNIFAGSVKIINDTIYALTAEIYAADGNKRGSVALSPNTHATWQQEAQKDIASSQTPYTVIFICTQSGSQYGMIRDIQQAATIRASTASGPHMCKDPKKK